MDILGDFRKVPDGDTTDWLMLPYGAKGLLMLLWRKVGYDGKLQLGKYGLRGVAAHVGSASDWVRVEPDLSDLLLAGAVIHDETAATLEVVGYVDAQGAYARSKDAERMRRKRDLEKSKPANECERVPNASEHVRECSTDQSRSELEKNREEEIKTVKPFAALAPPSLPGIDPGPDPAIKPKAAKVSEADLMASTLLGELSAARKRCNQAARHIQPTAGALKQIKGRLADKFTPADIRHVIAVLEERVKAGRYDFDYFGPGGPFKKDNFVAHLAKDIKAATPQRAPPVGRPDTITSSSTTEARVLNSRESLEKHLGIKVSERIVDGARSESDAGDASDF